MPDLIPPHGGLAEPVCRTVPPEEIAAFKAEAEKLTRVPVSQADLSTVYRIADGTLSPLTGPMSAAEYNQVLDQACIERSGKKYAWTIPLAFPVTAELAAKLKPGQTVALTNPGRRRSSPRSNLTDVFPLGQAEVPQERLPHRADRSPRCRHGAGGRCRQDSPHRRRTAGPAAAEEPVVRPHHPHAPRGPQAAGLQGLEPRRRLPDPQPAPPGHEYALVYGLESLLKDGHNAGAALNPLVGEVKGDDVNAEIRMQTYEALIKDRALGEGDSDTALWSKRPDKVADRVILIGLDIKMFYGGPKEAIMHAIYRQNNGFTDIVIGRKHADAPYKDGTAIWGDFDAQEMFGKLNGDLKIQPVKVGFAGYFESMGRVDLTENHPNEKPISIAGKIIREKLQSGELIDERIMRPSTSRILIAAMKK